MNCIWILILYIPLIFSLFYFLTFFISLLNFHNYILIKEIISSKEIVENELYKFIQPTYSDDRLILTNFNFEGKCREPFKYKRNNERDLIFTGIRYDNKKKWIKHKQSIKFATNLMNNTIPNAKKVCVIYGNDDELVSFVKNCGFETIKIEINENNQNLNPAIDRFIQLKNYLTQHEGEYDRVALIDFRDVFFLWISNNF